MVVVAHLFKLKEATVIMNIVLSFQCQNSVSGRHQQEESGYLLLSTICFTIITISTNFSGISMYLLQM